MDERILAADVSPEPIDSAGLADLVSRPDAGAVSVFVGRVRDHDPEAAGRVAEIEYSCHPDAAGELARVIADCLDPDALAAAARHRIGLVGVGEAAFVVAVASAHRRAAVESCSAIVEEAKRRLPIWKLQRTADGEGRWVGMD